MSPRRSAIKRHLLAQMAFYCVSADVGRPIGRSTRAILARVRAISAGAAAAYRWDHVLWPGTRD